MNEYIEVRPDPRQRVAFAVWSSAQDPQIRTVSLDTFAVPYELFTSVPENVLVGALVDGHLYRHVEEADVPQDSAASYEQDAPDADDPFAEEEDPFECESCERVFGTSRGLNKHRTSAHPEE